jgi:hypothetical protein
MEKGSLRSKICRIVRGENYISAAGIWLSDRYVQYVDAPPEITYHGQW